MRFTITIESENERMRSRLDVAYAIDQVAKKLRGNTEQVSGPIKDINGNTVGEWSLEDDEYTPVGIY